MLSIVRQRVREFPRPQRVPEAEPLRGIVELKPTTTYRPKGEKCGYATNPKYAHLLIDLIERYDLISTTSKALRCRPTGRRLRRPKLAQATARNEVLETVQNKELNPAKSANTIGRRSVQTSENYPVHPGRTRRHLRCPCGRIGPQPGQLYRCNDIDRKNGTYTPRVGEVIYP